MNKIDTEVIIVGGGPSGIACAIQLKRYNINTIVIEKDEIGGLIRNANLIENYPGFPVGISGETYAQLLTRQAKTNRLTIINEMVEKIHFSQNLFLVTTNNNLYHSKYLVIASGTQPMLINDIQIDDDAKTQVFYDIYKSGHIENKHVAIVGAGDCAFDYALNLSEKNDVTIINRTDEIKAIKILQNRARNNKNIKYLKSTTIKKLKKSANGLILYFSNTSDKMAVDYLLFAIGREPNLDFIDSKLLNHPNLFQVGDVKNGQFRQLTIAVGDGTISAMNINNINSLGK